MSCVVGLLRTILGSVRDREDVLRTSLDVSGYVGQRTGREGRDLSSGRREGE